MTDDDQDELDASGSDAEQVDKLLKSIAPVRDEDDPYDRDFGLDAAESADVQDAEVVSVSQNHRLRTGEQVGLATAIMDALPIARPLWDLEYWNARDAELEALERAQERAKAAEGLRARAHALRVSAGFPERAVERALSPGSTLAMAQARKFLADRTRTALVLAGATGTGKTSAAAWLALQAGGHAPAFLWAGELEARGRYDRGLRDWLRSKTMLVIDDIGAEPLDSKGFFRALLDETVNLFYGNKRMVVMTTNLTARIDAEAKKAAPRGAKFEPQFTERYGERLASRLFETGLWGSCGNRDLRRHPLTNNEMNPTTPKET